MNLSPHYYVISLSRDRNALFEAFRDQLIEVQNMGFPVRPVARIDGPTDGAEHDDRVLELSRMVDRRFENYYGREPLELVVVGEKDVQSAFSSVTKHGDAIVGYADGDYSASDPRDLGRAAWAVVKDAMSGTTRKALHDLDALAGRPGVASGLEAVALHVEAGAGGTLLVEEGYHVKGRIEAHDEALEISRSVDVREAMDDVIDVVVEKILKIGGNVVFLPAGSLQLHDRIALFPNEIA